MLLKLLRAIRFGFVQTLHGTLKFKTGAGKLRFDIHNINSTIMEGECFSLVVKNNIAQQYTCLKF